MLIDSPYANPSDVNFWVKNSGQFIFVIRSNTEIENWGPADVVDTDKITVYSKIEECINKDEKLGRYNFDPSFCVYLS